MQNKALHIVSFDIPFPANYGGIQDVFYKIKALSEQNITIYLHVFTFEKRREKELLNFVKEVYYYDRRHLKTIFNPLLPYRVASRKSTQLLKNLTKDNFPILFEGLQSSFLFRNKELLNRTKVIRSHNIESDYFFQQKKLETNLIKKGLVYLEEIRMRNFEKSISGSNLKIVAISNTDLNFYKNLKNPSLIKISAFHPNNSIDIKKGKGDYVLFHGNLSIAENIDFVNFYLEKIHNELDTRFVVAGKNPSEKLTKRISKYKNVTLFSNCSDNELKNIIQNAHINIIYSQQNSGIKLKLINSLYNGRFCIINQSILDSHHHLNSICSITNNKVELLNEINRLMRLDFTEDMIGLRNTFLNKNFKNDKNATELINFIFDS